MHIGHSYLRNFISRSLSSSPVYCVWLGSFLLNREREESLDCRLAIEIAELVKIISCESTIENRQSPIVVEFHARDFDFLGSLLPGAFGVSLPTTPVYRNLQTRVTFLYLEFEDLVVVVILAVLFNILGRLLDGGRCSGLPMSLVLGYGAPICKHPERLILFKYGKPGGYLMDWLSFHFKPRALLLS